MKIRSLIVDDMPLSLARTRRYLDEVPDIEVVDECASAEAALAAMIEQKPALIFLDVQMPGMSGFDLLEQLPVEQRPAVVFVTAFDEFAVPAFEVQAVDYLLKPFDRERLRQALAKVRLRLGETTAAATTNAPQNTLTRVAVKSVGKTEFVAVDDIDWIETAGNYVCLHTAAGECLVRETLAHLLSQLDPQQFVRIHRSTVVRIDRIRAMQPMVNGDRSIQLKDGTELALSRSYRGNVDAVLGT